MAGADLFHSLTFIFLEDFQFFKKLILTSGTIQTKRRNNSDRNNESREVSVG